MALKNWLIASGTVLLGVLSKGYEGPNEDIIRGYGWDFLLPIYLYNLATGFGMKNKRYGKALLAFGMCSAAEICQKIGVWSGTYDSKDFLAYISGAGVAWGLEVILDNCSKKKQTKLEEI